MAMLRWIAAAGLVVSLGAAGVYVQHERSHDADGPPVGRILVDRHRLDLDTARMIDQTTSCQTLEMGLEVWTGLDQRGYIDAAEERQTELGCR